MILLTSELKISCCFNLAAFSHRIMQLFLFASEQPNVGPLRLCPVTFSFAEVVALFSLGLFRIAFQMFVSTHSKILYQKLPLGKGFGYAVPERVFATPT